MESNSIRLRALNTKESNRLDSMFYVKYQNDNTYDMCGFNKDGNLYILQKVKVPRGMGHQTADELLIVGMNKKKINSYLKKHNAVIVFRDTEPELRVIKCDEKGKPVNEILSY